MPPGKDDADIDIPYGMVEEAYPEVYTKPRFPPPKKRKPGMLSDAQLDAFWNMGYVLLEDYFDIDTELEPCRRDIEQEVDDLAHRLMEGGKIKKSYKELGFFERMTAIDKEFPGAAVLLHKRGNLKDSFKKLWSNERLLNLMEQLIGPNIAGAPVWNLRVKTPQNASAVVPWHQDNGYTDNDSYRTLIPTAWIPLMDADEKNGCMQFARYGHRTGKIGKHSCCAGPTWYITLDDDDMQSRLGVDVEKDLQVVPVKYGSFVLFSNALPHRSLDNVSDVIRWSLDLRWQATDTPDCFYGLKKPIPMRLEGQPDFKINWDIDMPPGGDFGVKKSDTKEEYDKEFETTISGPWMIKWHVTDPNRHSKALEGKSVSWHKN